MEDYDLFDSIIHNSMMQLYLYAPGETIILKNFSLKEKSNKSFFKICQMAQEILGVKFEVDISILSYLYFRLIHRFKWKRGKNGKPLDVKETILQVEQATNAPQVFERIYDAYYKKGIK